MVTDKILEAYAELFSPMKIFYNDILLYYEQRNNMNTAGRLILLPLVLSLKLVLLACAVIMIIPMVPIWIPYQFIFDKIYNLHPFKKISDACRRLFFYR
jgi:hypothetical protein